MSYSAEERESNLNCTDAEKTWKIYTLMPTVITKLKRTGAVASKVDPDGAHYFELDFNQVSFRAKSNRKPLTEEQRQVRRDALAKGRNKKKDEGDS